jgi:hypothetical protein
VLKCTKWLKAMCGMTCDGSHQLQKFGREVAHDFFCVQEYRGACYMFAEDLISI